MADKDRNRNGEDWNYQPSFIDLRFLKAIDHIIEKNKVAKVKPATDSSISKMIFGRRNVIREIRNFQRGVSITELHKFALYFHLDFNYFFRGTKSIMYHSQTAGNNEGKAIIAHNIGNVIGDNMKGTIFMGDVYIINVDEIIS